MLACRQHGRDFTSKLISMMGDTSSTMVLVRERRLSRYCLHSSAYSAQPSHSDTKGGLQQSEVSKPVLGAPGEGAECYLELHEIQLPPRVFYRPLDRGIHTHTKTAVTSQPFCRSSRCHVTPVDVEKQTIACLIAFTSQSDVY